jgi:hypothetical protein
LKIRFESQLSRMNCQTFSTGLSSGHLGGSGMSVMFGGQFGRAVPSGLIEQDDGVRAGRDVEGDLHEMHAHGLAVAPGHDDAGSLAFSGTDRPEDPCRGAALILRR